MLAKSETSLEEVKGMKNLVNSSQSFVPGILEVLSRRLKATSLFSDYNFHFEGVECKQHFSVQPLKKDPKSVFEETSAYILVEDTID